MPASFCESAAPMKCCSASFCIRCHTAWQPNPAGSQCLSSLLASLPLLILSLNTWHCGRLITSFMSQPILAVSLGGSQTSPELLETSEHPRITPNFPWSSPATSQELLSQWISIAIQRIPKSSQTSPEAPRTFPISKRPSPKVNPSPRILTPSDWETDSYTHVQCGQVPPFLCRNLGPQGTEL